MLLRATMSEWSLTGSAILGKGQRRCLGFRERGPLAGQSRMGAGRFFHRAHRGWEVARRAKSVVSDGLPEDNPFARERECCSLKTSSPTCRTPPDFALFGQLETVSGE